MVPNKKKADLLGVLDGSKKIKKINPLVLTSIVGSLFTLVAVLMVLKVSADKRNELASVNSLSSQSAQVIKARENFLTTRKAYVEKLNRTDYSTNIRTNIDPASGEGVQTGWRQLSGAKWSQDIKSDLSNLRNDPKHPLYRMGETPALEVLKLQTLGTLSEIAAGNTTFYVGYVKTDGTKVEQKLSTGAAAYLTLGKLEAIDLANTLESIPEVNFSLMLNDIGKVNESYVLALRGYLQAQGYKDPVDQLGDARKTADEIQLLQDLKNQKLRDIQKPSQSQDIQKFAPEPRPVLRRNQND